MGTGERRSSDAHRASEQSAARCGSPRPASGLGQCLLVLSQDRRASLGVGEPLGRWISSELSHTAWWEQSAPTAGLVVGRRVPAHAMVGGDEQQSGAF